MQWDRIKAQQSDLLDWDRLTVKVVKDPERPLSVVSDLGVPHAGMERDSSVHRLSDGAVSFIVKRHRDPVTFRREAANITFVNEAGGFAPELHWADPETGILLMEDLGDRSLAWVWKRGDMAEYERWVYEAVDSVLLRIRRRSRPLVPQEHALLYRQFVSSGFGRARTNLRQGLKRVFTPRQWKRLAGDLDFEVRARPTDLGFEQWLGLFDFLVAAMARSQIPERWAPG